MRVLTWAGVWDDGGWGGRRGQRGGTAQRTAKRTVAATSFQPIYTPLAGAVNPGNRTPLRSLALEQGRREKGAVP